MGKAGRRAYLESARRSAPSTTRYRSYRTGGSCTSHAISSGKVYGDPSHPQEGDTIGIWDQETGKSEIVWNIFDHISPSDRTEPDSDRRLPGFPLWGGCDRDRSVQDWSHANSVVMAPDGSYILSLRHLDQVVSISSDFKKVQWRLGGPGSDFTFPNPEDRFYEQHTATQLPNGNILLFDNGNDRPNEEGGQYSRPLEFQLDHKNKTARAVWQFKHNPQLFAVCCSSVERLPNGNTLVLYGSSFLPDPRPFKIMEITPEGRVVWEGRPRLAGQADPVSPLFRGLHHG